MDVGSGSGYTCAVFRHLVSPSSADKKGKVVGIDHIPELVDWSVENLRRDSLSSALGAGDIQMVTGDGRQGLLRRGDIPQRYSDSDVHCVLGYPPGGKCRRAV